MRESFDDYMLRITEVVSSRATCPRRQVGCVIVDKNKHIIATGYNGVPKGYPHCTDKPCGGQDSESGKNLNACMATHAEQNALLQCRDVNSIDTIYITTSPCITCAKLIANTSCKRIVCSSMYNDMDALSLLSELGITVECY